MRMGYHRIIESVGRGGVCVKYNYEYQGEIHSITLDSLPDGRYQATIGDDRWIVSATQVSDGTWLIDHANMRTIAHTARSGDDRYVQIDGTQYTLSKANTRRRRQDSSSASGSLVAEMPGQVIDVRVSAGDAVTSGDVLVVLEAMKMEIRITAPHDGIVAKLLVAEGDIVDRGQTLAEVKPE